MIYAKAISFNENDEKTLTSIVQIKLETDGSDSWTIDDKPIDGWFLKENIHQWLKSNDRFKIKVNESPYPYLESVEDNGTKYVRSERNRYRQDNLLELPKYVEK